MEGDPIGEWEAARLGGLLRAHIEIQGVRFRIVFVCFWGISGPMTGLSVESEVDPFQTLRLADHASGFFSNKLWIRTRRS